jgi:hypothetical protein
MNGGRISATATTAPAHPPAPLAGRGTLVEIDHRRKGVGFADVGIAVASDRTPFATDRGWSIAVERRGSGCDRDRRRLIAAAISAA